MPESPAIATARACSAGSAATAARIRTAVSSASACCSGVTVITPSSASRSVGSAGTARRARTASIARLCAIVVNQVRAAPRVVHLGVPPGPLERLLGHVLGQLYVTQHRQRDPEHDALEPPYERNGDLRVTGGEPGQQSLVRGSAERPDSLHTHRKARRAEQ